MSRIKYIGFYDIDLNEERGACLASNTKMDYICEALVATGNDVEIISLLTTSKVARFSASLEQIKENIWLRKFSARRRSSSRIIRGLALYFDKVRLFIRLFFLLKRTDVVISYHSLASMWMMATLHKLIGFRLILEVEEIYNDVIKKSDKLRAKEIKALQASDAYILPCKELNDVVSVMRNWSNRGGGRRIGCRDLSTLKVLRDMGFDAYFSSCLTTTLFYEFGRIPFAEREGVVFCDVNFDKRFPLSILLKRRKMKKACEEILLSYKNEPVYKVTHMCPVSESHESRFALARSLLRLYSSAKVVITSRIHCALPCLAMGTPVILAVDNYDNKRYPGIDAFLNKVYYSSSGEFVADIQLQSGLVVNNEKHLSYANDLIRECESFVKSCSD